MENDELKIPRYVYEDLLFQRRLQRDLNAELEKLNALLAEQARLLKERKELMAEVHAAVQHRWSDEEKSEFNSQSVTVTEEDRNAK
jgi:hypothetical protein